MHFLCLHGSGTNSQILELQTAAIRYQLGPEHTYDFVEGEYDHPMEPGVAHLVSPGDTFHAYFDFNSTESILATLDDLDCLIRDAQPPYDAVLGFSVGACLAATLLLRDAHSPTATAASQQLRLAVFLAPGMALSYDALLRGKVEVQEITRNSPRIEIPTAFVHADNDETTPGHGDRLRKLCAGHVNEVAVHHLGHSVPGHGQQKELKEAVAAIKRAVATAESGALFVPRLR